MSVASPPLFHFVLFAALAVAPTHASERRGAETPWITFEAEAMTTNATALGPRYDPFLVETESAGQRCVKLASPGQFVEFRAGVKANALLVRYSLPDTESGVGAESNLFVAINGRRVKTLPITSKHSWLYGKYPFTNQPKDGKPRNFYDEVRIDGLKILPDDVIRLEKALDEVPSCIIDLVDLEDVAPALNAPANALSVMEFGAGGKGESDDTEALRKCLSEGQRQGRTVWIPAGQYKVTGDIVLPSHVKLQGAGMWHTVFVGDEKLYQDANRRVRFKLTGTDIHLADFAIVGKLNYRNDDEPNDGLVVAGCSDSTISRIWIEHTKTGIWVYNGARLVIEGCRFRNLLADGVNLCVGTHHCIIQNCSARGTGDDCFAIWPAPSDQGYVEKAAQPGNNIIRRCTGQSPFLANGGAIYGGADNRVENCLFTDITAGCGILISTTFPTSDEQRKVDNNFSGTTAVYNCRLLRCGGYDHSWAWRGSLQICLDRRSISGLDIRDLDIEDSLSDGLTIVAPGSAKDQGILSISRIENATIRKCGIGSDSHRGLWIRNDAKGSISVIASKISNLQNDSAEFSVLSK